MSLSSDRANFSTAWAPAKVNLYLHVGAAGPGGLHPVDSLVMFADTRAADRILARPAPHVSLSVEGPGAKQLKNAPNNLAVAAAKALRDACDRTGLGAALTLYKVLPVAGGVGGGSSDAAATLLVLNEMWGVEFGEAALERIAAQLGSDVPACVRQRPVVMRGTGERLIDVAAPDVPAILVNPGIMLETRKVFDRFDRMGANNAFREAEPPWGEGPVQFADALDDFSNDLQPAAVALCPEIKRALSLMEAQPGCLLARMSGSGPTCFALFGTDAEAAAAATAISEAKKKYWVKATTFRGAPPVPIDD
jgi:4-diphosphocytidyl-2-C-methyl-D-erythritol kinase